jgi:hypothetical protein
MNVITVECEIFVESTFGFILLNVGVEEKLISLQTEVAFLVEEAILMLHM